jgi:hypothetical protein
VPRVRRLVRTRSLEPGLLLNPKFTPELIGYIEKEHLPTRGLGQRLLWYVWKIANPGLVRQARGNVASDRYS